ncbi:MAG: methyltransferase [Rhodospirillales bacterium]|jgi:SAM-dependent methyltransferase|nr:methyltransferase [Rhodospirillales bacterium]
MTGDDDRVRAQYKALPYPERDPADEAKRLVTGSPSHLAEVNHFVFAGRRDFSLSFRALVAGGGTGDGAIMMAQQLSDAGDGGTVIYTDPSRAARAIAEARAEARRLANIEFRTLAIEEAADAGLGSFDYVDCCGVLHHLADPAAGLMALAGLLAPKGGMGLMVYGTLGRAGVYPLQALLRMLSGGDGEAARIAFARRLLDDLPATNAFKRNPFVGDHLSGGDAGLFDLLLHSRDRAYRVPEIAELAAAAGLRITAFVEPARYDPASYVKDPAILERLAGLDRLERWAAAELIAGNMTKHVFYAVEADHPGPAVATADDANAVAHLRLEAGEDLAAGIKPGRALTATIDGVSLRFPLPPLARAMVERIDGTRSLADIHAQLLEANPDLERDAFMDQFARLYAALNGLGKLYLSYPPG